MSNTTFKVFINHKVSKDQSKADYSFKSSISLQPRWIQTLTSNHILSDKKSLLEVIVNSDPIRISTDGSKTTLKSGGSLIVATKSGEHFAKGYLPIFGQQKYIHSYRIEIHASLLSIIVLHIFSNYYSVDLPNSIDTVCDNEGFVNKLNTLILNPRVMKTLFKIPEYETIQAMITYIPRNYTIRHVESHQDDNIPYANLTLDAKLNVQTDKIATVFVTQPINNHISIPPFTIYLHGEYIHHWIDKIIRFRRNEKETRKFSRTKYKWKLTTFNNIDWTAMSSSLGKQSFYKNINIRKFIHHRLALSKINFALHHECPYC